jgi:hypothetical protein
VGYIKPEGIEKVWEEQLLASRSILKTEMLNVLHCESKDDKKALYRRWKAKYSELMVQDLVKCAKDHKSCLMVANWNLNNFELDRRSNHRKDK